MTNLTPFSAEIEQRARELAEYRAALDARARGDRISARRHMQRLSEIHKQRPPEMVARIERERGLA